MEITVASQTQVFGLSCLFGVVLGIYYDVFRIIRLVVRPGKKAVFFYDVLYLLSCGVFTFLFCFAVNYGEVRFYLLAGEGIGWCLYHLTLGELIMRCSAFLTGVIKRVLLFLRRHITAPVVRLCGKIKTKAAAFSKKRREKKEAKRKQKKEQRQKKKQEIAQKRKKSQPKSKMDLKQQGNLVYNQKRHYAPKTARLSPEKKRKGKPVKRKSKP